MDQKIVIGRGGYGEVYYDVSNPNIVYKRSHNHECTSLKHEYSMWNKAYQAYLKYSKQFPQKTKHLAILRPSKWIKLAEGNQFTECIFQMKRIQPIEGEMVWHPQLGAEKNLDVVIKTDQFLRGRQVGINVLRKYFNLKELTQAAGTLIAIIHYGAKLDAFDTELTLGKIKKTQYKLYLLDFDQTKSWSQIKTKAELIERMVSSLEDVPYYPNPSSYLFKYFKAAYLKVAQFYGEVKLAKEVLNEMFIV